MHISFCEVRTVVDIKGLRRRAGISQKAMAAAINLSQARLFEAGKGKGAGPSGPIKEHRIRVRIRFDSITTPH